MTTEKARGREERLESCQETTLRSVALKGADQKDAVEQSPSDADTSVHVDGEEDTLYDDELKIGDDSGTLMGTRGNPLP